MLKESHFTKVQKSQPTSKSHVWEHLLNEQIFRREWLLQYSGIICENTKGGVSSPTTAGFISSFQFCSKTPVANKSASFLVAGTDFLVTVCKYSEVACKKAATQKEFPPKKKEKAEWGGLSLDQRFGTKMASMHHTYGALSAGVMFSLLWFCSLLVSFLFYFSTQTVLCHCVIFFFTPINDCINRRYDGIIHWGVLAISTRTP